MIGVERRKPVQNLAGKDVHSGAINIPKNKLRGGSKPRLSGKFYLVENAEHSIMDFDEPFLVEEVINESQFGIYKHKGKFHVPSKFVEHAPNYEAAIKPLLVTQEDKTPEDGLYYPSKNLGEIVELLKTSNRFEEEALDAYEVVEVV
jgi:hypothetical protein